MPIVQRYACRPNIYTQKIKQINKHKTFNAHFISTVFVKVYVCQLDKMYSYEKLDGIFLQMSLTSSIASNLYRKYCGIWLFPVSNLFGGQDKESAGVNMSLGKRSIKT